MTTWAAQIGNALYVYVCGRLVMKRRPEATILFQTAPSQALRLPTMGRKDDPWYSTPRAMRKRRGIEITLSDDARARLEWLAAERGVALSRVVEDLIMEAK